MKKYADKINYIFVMVYVTLFLCCFISQDVYAIAGKLASLISFFVFALYACSVFERMDIYAIVVCFGCVVTGINLIYINSNKGAFFTAADLLLMLYVSGRITFSRIQKLLMSGVGATLLLFWYSTVRWDYNFNMAGLVFMVTGISCLVFFELLKEKYEYLKYIQVLSYFVTLLFCTLYHSRCAMMGMIIFGVLYCLSPLIVKYKWIQYLLIAFSTLGAVLFTLIYVGISYTGWNLTILYKEVLSGRQLIWEELWQALSQHPITGIGSAYKLKSFFIFEVHNGLFDILAVHGVIVFICVLVMLINKLYILLKNVSNDNMGKIVIAGVFSILFTSFFENFFIVSPYLLFIFFLMSLGTRQREKS